MLDKVSGSGYGLQVLRPTAMLYEPKLIQIAPTSSRQYLYALDNDGNVWELFDDQMGRCEWTFIGSPTAADLKNKQ